MALPVFTKAYTGKTDDCFTRVCMEDHLSESEETHMRQSFLKGTLFITIAALVSKLLGGIFRIPLQNIAGDEVLGIFTLVYPLYMVALTLSVAGIPIAISKLISEAESKGAKAEIRDIYLTARFLGVGFGLVGFLVLYGFSKQFSILFGGSSSQLAIIVVSLTLLVAPYMAVYRGYFQGFGDMRPTALSQVLEQFIRVGLMIGIAFIFVESHASDRVIAGGVMAGSFVGALCSLFYLRWIFSKTSFTPVSNKKYSIKMFSFWTKRILSLSVPIAIGTLTMALLNLVDSFTIPFSLKAYGQDEINYLYGLYGRGLSLTQIATVFSTSLVLPMVPMISAAIARNEVGKAITTTDQAQRFNHFISWPAAIGVFSLALPLNVALFGDIKESLVLAVLGFSSLLISLTVLGTGILSGINLQKAAAYTIIMGAVLKVFLNFFFVSKFGLIGVAISSIIVYGLLIVVNTLMIKKHYPFSMFTKDTTTYIIASCVMGAAVGLPTLFLEIGTWTRAAAFAYTVVGVLTGAMIYGIIVVKRNGSEEFTQLPVVGKFFMRFKNW
jgi:O-antigen/teichoic acid export membrane protein